jgi:hypothetical protein
LDLARVINSQLSKAESLPVLADMVTEWGSSFDAIHTATAFTKAGKLAPGRAAAASSKQLLNRLAGIWERVLPDAELHSLANVLWACGKLQYASPQLWSSTLAAYTELLQQHQQAEMVGQHISNVLHGLANASLATEVRCQACPGKHLLAWCSSWLIVWLCLPNIHRWNV